MPHTAPPRVLYYLAALWPDSYTELATPQIFMVFDCLYIRGKDLRGRPLHVRRNLIENMLDGQDLVLPVRRLADDGPKNGSRPSSPATGRESGARSKGSFLASTRPAAVTFLSGGPARYGARVS